MATAHHAGQVRAGELDTPFGTGKGCGKVSGMQVLAIFSFTAKYTSDI